MKGSSGHDDLSIHREGLRVFRYLALALALIATSGWAQQTRYVEEAGEDTSDCSASPCASIQYAIDQSAAGDTIEVGAGTYVGELHIHLDDLTLVSVAGADDTIVDADDSINGIEIGDHSHPGNHPDGVTVEGFQVINWVERGISQRNGTGTVFIRDNILLGPESGARNGINISGGTGSEVTGNEIVTSSFDQDNWSGTGILAMGSVNALIEHNLISGPDIGVAVVGGFSSVDPAWAQASGNIVRDNTITGSSSGAIGLQGDAGGTLIEDNELIDNNRGIEVSESGHGAYPSDVEIRGNFIADNGTGIAFFDPGSHDPGQLTVEDNVFEGNQLNLGDGTGTIDDQDFEQNNEINQLVRLVATDGEDSGNCSEDACLTIQYAVNQAAPGDTISIASGTYREQVGISKSLIIDADPGAVLEAPDTMSVIEFPENSDEWVPMMLVYGGSLSGGEITGSSVVDVDVSGLEFDGRDLSHSERFPAILYRNANGLIANNSIHSMGNLEGNESFGVSVYGDSIVEVVNNHITGYGRGGIGIQGSDGPYPHPDGLVVGNTLVGIGYGENQPSGANAIQVAWGATGAVMDNTVTGGWHEDADVAGVFVGLGSDDVVVADNYLAGNGAGVQVYDASGTEITGNVIEDGDYGMDIGYGNSDTVIDGNEIRNQFLDGILVWTQSTAITNTQITNNLIEESDWGLTLFVNEPGEIDGIDVTANHFVDNNRQLVDNAELLDEQDFLAANTFDITLTLDLSTGLPSALESGSGWAGFTAQLTSVGEVPENVLLWIEVDGIDNSNVEDLTLQYYNPAIDDWSTFGWGGFGGGDFPEMDREGYFIGRDGSTLVGFEIPAGYDELIPLRVDWPNGSYQITTSIESFEDGAENNPGDRLYLSQADTLDVVSEPDELEVALESFDPSYLQGDSQAGTEQVVFDFIDNDGGNIKYVFNVFQVFEAGTGNEIDYAAVFADVSFDPEQIRGLTGTDAGVVTAPGDLEDVAVSFTLQPDAPLGDYDIVITSFDVTGIDAGDVTLADALAGEYPVLDDDSVQIALDQAEGQIAGLVELSGAGAPLITVEGLEVTATRDSAVVASDTTDASGAYSLEGLPAGTYNVAVESLEGLTTADAEVTLASSADEQSQDFVLESTVTGAFAATAGGVGIDAQTFAAGRSIEDVDLSVTRDDGGATLDFYVSLLVFDSQWQQIDYTQPDVLFTEQTLQALANVLGPDGEFTLAGNDSEVVLDGAELELAEGADALDVSVFRFRLVDARYGDPGNRLKHFRDDYGVTIAPQDELGVALAGFEPEYQRGAMETGSEQVVFDYTANAGDIEQVFNVFTVLEGGVEIDPGTYEEIFESVEFVPAQIRGLTGTDASVVTAPGDLDVVSVQFLLEEDAPLGDYEIVITSYDVTGIDPDDVALGDTDTYRVLDTASQAMSLIQGPELELTIDGPELLSLAEEGDYDVRLQNTGDAEVGENVEVQFAIARAGIEPGDVVVDYCIDETATSGEDCADWAELTLEADNGSLSGRFGPGDGFEVDEDYDRTTFIRAAFTEPGNYDASAQAVGVDSDEVYATGMTEVAITELAFDIEAGVDQAVPTPDEGEGWAYYTATLVNLGDELPELVRLFIEVHDSDGQLIDDAFDFEFWNTTTETWDSLAWDADDQRWAFGPASGFVIDDEYEAATPVRVNFSNDLYDLAVSVETADQQADTVWVYGEFEEQIGVISEAVNLDFDIERGVQAPDQPPRWDYFTATLSNIDGGATPDDIVLYVAVDETDFAAGDALEFWNGSEWQNFGWDADREAWFLGRDGAGGVSGFPIDADEVFEIEIRVNFLPDVYTGTITVESFDDSIVGVGGVYGEFVESVEVLPTPADITFDAGDLVQTFDGTEKSVGVTTAPEPGLDVEFIFDPAPPVDAGSYAVTATVIDPYFEGDATETLVIEPAEAQVMLDDLVQVFDGEPKPVSVTTDPAGLNVNITYDGDSQVPTNAGEYSVVAEIDDPNYTGQADATLVIEQAPVELFFEDLTQVYDGDPKQVTVTTDPQGVDVAVTYDGSSDAPVDAGSYLVVAEVVDPNYEPISDNAVFVIEPGQAEVILSDLTQVYDSGNPLPVTVETVPAGLAVTVTYDGGSQAPGEAGSYSVFASVDDANWTGTASGLLVIEPAEAAIMLDGLEQTYDGTPREVTATTDPAGLAVEITYDGQAMPPVDAGSYEVVATVDDANHVGSVTDTLVVAQAEVDEIQINDLEQVHDGEPKPVTVITLPAGLDVTITYDGQETPPVDAGSYLVEVEVVDNNYFGSADDTLVVEQGEQTIDFPVLPDRSVDDSPFTITASASSGLAVSFDVVSGPATIDGDTVTLTGELGEVVIEANQPGDDNWQPADPVQQSFEVVEGDGNTIEAVSATTIGGEAGEPVDAADLPTVRVLDEADNPVSGVTVSFEVTSGGGSISGATQVTDSDGLAQVEEWVLGGEAVQTLTASAPGLAGSPVEFTAEVDAVVNLEISITDNRDTIEPGERNTYVIVVSNEGPNEADGANVIVELPAELLADSADWVCYAGPAATCTDSGTGGIDDTVMLEAGANVIYVLEADVDDQATGIVEVTASVTLDEVVAEDVTTTQIVITEDSIFQDRFESDDEPEGSVNADASRIEGHLMISGNYRGGLPPRVLLGGRDGDGNDVFRIRSLAFEHLALVRVELRDEHGFWSHGEWLAMQPAEEGVLGFEYDAESGLLILAGDSADDLVQSRSTAPVAHELFTESSDQVEIVIEQ